MGFGEEDIVRERTGKVDPAKAEELNQAMYAMSAPAVSARGYLLD